jgi:hypothetical protein
MYLLEACRQSAVSIRRHTIGLLQPLPGANFSGQFKERCLRKNAKNM